jgi:hypothetical protein
MSRTTWREEISREMEAQDDDWDNVESMTLSASDLDRGFDDDYGAIEGVPFTVWTKSRVYFPCGYDGREWADSVARHPDGVPSGHRGGGI